MALEVTTDKKRLIDIMEGAQQGTVALPQFQRNFVWARDKIEDLLRSLIKGYYVGSFLVLDVDKEAQPFAIRPIVGVDLKPQNMRPTWLLLDGQQRLTSLHYAFTAPDEGTGNTKHPYRFFIRLDKILEGADEEIVFSERADRTTEWEDEKYQFEQRVLPLTSVADWANWKDRYDDWLVDTDQMGLREKYRKEWREVWRAAIEDNILKRYIPYVELPRVRDDDDEGIAEVCTVFEKINSTGEPLSVYDLLTARLYKYGVDVHALWRDAMSEKELLAKFTDESSETYGIYVLRAIGLLRGLEVKAKSLVNLKSQDFEEDWRRAVDALELALQRLRSTQENGFGVFDFKWQPYTTLLPVLAAALARLRETKAGPAAYADLQAWYWGSIFTERYASAVESKSYKDYMDLKQRFEDQTVDPVAFKDVREQVLDNVNFSLRDISRVSSRYKAIMNLVAIEGARDFLNNDNIEFHVLEDHHIFPVACLGKKFKITDREAVNTVVNRTLIADSTNRKISQKSPSDYLYSVLPDGHRESILRSHFITAEAQEAMSKDDYETFLQARDRALVAKVRSLVVRAAEGGK